MAQCFMSTLKSVLIWPINCMTDMLQDIVKILPCFCQNFLALLCALRKYYYFLFGKKKGRRKIWNEAPNLKVAIGILEALLNFPSSSENIRIIIFIYHFTYNSLNLWPPAMWLWLAGKH